MSASDGIIVSITCRFPATVTDLPDGAFRLLRSVGEENLYEVARASFQAESHEVRTSLLGDFLQSSANDLQRIKADMPRWLSERGAHLEVYITLFNGPEGGHVTIDSPTLAAWVPLGATFTFDSM